MLRSQNWFPRLRAHDRSDLQNRFYHAYKKAFGVGPSFATGHLTNSELRARCENLESNAHRY